MNKKKEIELARKFFDLIFREVENGEDVIYDFIDPECRYKTLCDKLNNETVKEVLELGFKQKYGEEWHGRKGERNNVDPLYDAKAVGNAAAMHEEVAGIRNTANSALTALSLGNDSSSFLWDIIRKCKAAVAKPPRNCDVGTPEEQAERFHCQCFEYHTGRCSPHCRTLPAKTRQECALKWAQMPYEANEKGEVDDSNG